MVAAVRVVAVRVRDGPAPLFTECEPGPDRNQGRRFNVQTLFKHLFEHRSPGAVQTFEHLSQELFKHCLNTSLRSCSNV